MSARPGVGRASTTELRERQLRVFGALSNGNRSVYDIATATRLTRLSVADALQRLRVAGEVQFSRNDGWSIVEDA